MEFRVHPRFGISIISALIFGNCQLELYANTKICTLKILITRVDFIIKKHDKVHFLQ